MTDQLDSATDAKLGETFAREVADMHRSGFTSPLWAAKGSFTFGALPPFATSADAVLPFADRIQWQSTRWNAGRANSELAYWVNLPMGAPNSVEAEAPTLARALCIALIRHHRAARAQKASMA